MKTYEAMFLLDAGNTDFEATSAPVREVLERAGSEILSMKPWDERRLAFKIKGRKRALYVLTYFKADPAVIDELQHDIQLNDRILRALILSGDHVGEEQIDADTPATIAETRRIAAEAELAAKKEAKAKAEAEAEAEEQSQPDEAAPDESPATPEVTETPEAEATEVEQIETPEATEASPAEETEEADTAEKD